MIGPRHAELLAKALRNLIGPPIKGTVAFLRCLPSEMVDGLIDAPELAIKGWQVAAVVDKPGSRRIAADQAVEQREDKAQPIFLLIDPLRAGAGLDGIYSSAKEITEVELFKAAQKEARRHLRGKLQTIDGALKRAKQLGRRQTLTPWQEFDFQVVAEKENLGAAISRIGLWPIGGSGVPSDEELKIAADLSDRLFFLPDSRPAKDRVSALLLGDAEHCATMEAFLRDVEDRSPLEAIHALNLRNDLWLGTLKPQFSGQFLQHIELVSWRKTNRDPQKWSGLLTGVEKDAPLRFLLDRNLKARDQAKLEIRWTTEPESIPTGTVEYRVTLLAGDEELVSQTVAHKEKLPQKAVFSTEEFEEFDEGSKYEAVVRIEAVGSRDVDAVESESFGIEFGEAEEKVTIASGQIVRALVEGVILKANVREFEEAADKAHFAPWSTQDKNDFVSWRTGAGRGARVLRPALIRAIEESFVARMGEPGRWHLRIRSDGTANGPPEFKPISRGACAPELWEKAKIASRRLANDLGQFGFVARVQRSKLGVVEEFVKTWIETIEQVPEAALLGTVSVLTMSGRTLGLIVTPLHPLRLAWHRLYDHVTAQVRYEQGVAAPAVAQILRSVDGTHLPSMLPGADGVRGFLFANTLGFHAVAMTVDGEQEPKSAVALMLAALRGGGEVASTDEGTTSVLAREISHYLACHAGAEEPERGLELLNLQAWRAGDGMTVARALGRVLEEAPEDDEAEEKALCFTLDLHHPKSTAWGSGRFLSDVGRKRRSGTGIAAQDRWMTETARRDGEIIVPRLRWALKDETGAPQPSHLAVAFDIFAPSLETRPRAELAPARPLHAYGLLNIVERRVTLEGDPEWLSFTPPEVEGAKAPKDSGATDSLLGISRVISEATARSLGGGSGDWPVVVTRLPVDSRAWIDRLHDRSDWVVTIDRNACIEYFDAPLQLPDLYERFVIDAIPERTDLGTFQLITTTKNLDEVRDLLDVTLGDMGLTSSERNSRFLLSQLKGLSGRLAMRLANPGTGTGELIALALMRASCVEPGEVEPAWLDLKNGFLVPVDEIADRPPVGSFYGEPKNAPERRADFIHVQVPHGPGALRFRFVEVKYRAHLRIARQPALLDEILEQTKGLRERWQSYYFGVAAKATEGALRRSQLALLLRFYAERAYRHGLEVGARARVSEEIDALVLKGDYKPAVVEQPDIGYVFCPEHRTGVPERLYVSGGESAAIWLFGPGILPDGGSASGGARTDGEGLRRSPNVMDTQERSADAQEPTPTPYSNAIGVADAVDTREFQPSAERPGSTTNAGATASEQERQSEVNVALGTIDGGSEPISWRVSVRGNPHMMMVGLPGMGKTTALINICRRLEDANIAPIVFSYHEDIDEKLGNKLKHLDFVDYNGLGFNPLRVDAYRRTAHVDVAGTLRDIFGSIFPDLGDLQLEDIRQAIKQSFDDLGWGSVSEGGNIPPLPPFRAFFEILTAKAKPNVGLLARLAELSDYGFFDATGDRSSLLSERRPTIVRIHATQNEMLQSAFSSFVLYSIYKDMFRRGVQREITHAIVFDEAHRAARLKLIPQFAKECRKYGLSLVLASQEAKDFAPALFSAISTYLVLRVTEPDARTLARMTAAASDEKRIADQMKALPRYTGVFLGEGRERPATIALLGDA